MSWQARMPHPERDHWHRALECARGSLPMAAPPEELTAQELALGVLHAAQAKGLLRLVQGEGVRFTPLGHGLVDLLLALGDGDPTRWVEAVMAVERAEAHPDPDAYFGSLESVVAPASVSIDIDLEAAGRVWPRLERLERRVGQGYQRVLLTDDEGAARICAWVPADSVEVLRELPLAVDAIGEWTGQDGRSILAIPANQLGGTMLAGARLKGWIRTAESSVGLVPVAITGHEAVLEVLERLHPASPNAPDWSETMATLSLLAQAPSPAVS